MSNKKLDKYNILLESAEQLFADKGFHQTKIKDITDNASLGAGTFYLYFKNKDELLNELMQKYMETIFKKFLDILNSNKAADKKLEDIIRNHVEFMCENKGFFKIYIEQAHTSGCLNPLKNKEQLNMKLRFFELVEILIKEGQEENVFSKSINLNILSRSLLGMIGFSVVNLLVIEENKNITSDEIADNICRIFIKGLKNED